MKLLILFLFTVTCNGFYLRHEKNHNLQKCHSLRAGAKHHGRQYHHIVSGGDITATNIVAMYYDCDSSSGGLDTTACLAANVTITVENQTYTETSVAGSWDVKATATISPYPMHVLAVITAGTSAFAQENTQMCVPGSIPGPADGDPCVQCSAGTYNDGTSKTCDACEPEYYAASAGTSTCTKFENCNSEGRHMLKVGDASTARTCGECSSGYYRDSCAHDICVGTHVNHNAVCIHCETFAAGFYCAGGNALPQCKNDGVPNSNHTGEILLIEGESLPVKCDVGYNGDATLTCGALGSASIAMSCTAQACPDINVANSDKTGVSISYDDADVVVTCDSGYDANGPFTVSCGSDGVKSSDPSCLAKTCTITTANSDKENVAISHGAAATTVKCNDGYGIGGGATQSVNVSCTDGVKSSDPSCDKRSCAAFTVANSGSTGVSLQSSGNATVICTVGYNAVGYPGGDTQFVVLCDNVGALQGQQTCSLIDDCRTSSDAYVDCETGGTCADTGSSYQCNCQKGYGVKDGVCELCTEPSYYNDDTNNSPCGDHTECSADQKFSWDGTSQDVCSDCADRHSSAGGFVVSCTADACATGKNGQACVNSGSATGTGALTNCGCNCASGYSGDNCQTADACATGKNGQACQHNGNATGSGALVNCGCNCAFGYLGDNCQTAVACTTGKNGQACDNSGSATGSGALVNCGCSCDSGYSGDNCETDINECGPDPCQNSGVCTDAVDAYSCACPFEYGGTNCENALGVLYGYATSKNGGDCNARCIKWTGSLENGFDETAGNVEFIPGDAICNLLLSSGNLIASNQC